MRYFTKRIATSQSGRPGSLSDSCSMPREKSYEELCQPLKPGSLAAIQWGLVSAALRTLGKTSHGIRIGFQHGFDSGPMLDYIYQNKAEGALVVGQILDRVFLNQIGWRGIRQRKVHMQQLLNELIQARHTRSQPAHVVDVASGPGRYLLELTRELGEKDLKVTLRDWDAVGLEQAASLVREFGLTHVQIQRGDAFSPEDLKRITPPPQIVVVSGLYELFPDNSRITRSLNGIYALLEEGGQLVYTNQPTHPQLEMIARCLPNREGKSWVMRLRSQEEMDQLVTEAGFQHQRTLADQWGIFTVSVAQKRLS